MITIEELRRQYRYEEGQLFIIGARPGKKWGTPSGAVGSKGYRQVNFRGRTLQVHRVVWALHYGTWPKLEIDHIDGNKLNNRIENLREVTHRDNMLNANTWNGKQDGLPLNISFHRNGKYRARVWVGNKRVEKYAETLEIAIQLRDALLTIPG